MPIIRLDSINSTNDYLRKLTEESILENGTVVVTQEQTSGRGQQGNHWESEPDKNLTFSILLYPTEVPIKNIFLISQITALSIKEVLDEYFEETWVKWPNDIYVGDKKIAGILIENDFAENVFAQSIIGIGLNVNQEVFRSNAPNPVSMKQLLGIDIDLDFLLEKIIKQLLLRRQALLFGEFEKIRKDYFLSLYRRTGFHLFSDKNGQFTATIDQVEESGHLVLKTAEKEIRKYLFKEVSYITNVF